MTPESLILPTPPIPHRCEQIYFGTHISVPRLCSSTSHWVQWLSEPNKNKHHGRAGRFKHPYELFIHEHPLTSIEQAAEERGLQTAQIIRSLLFRTSKEGFVMVLMPGPAQVSWSKLRHYLGISRLTTASEGEVLEMTGYERGAVSPLGLRGTIRILGDEGICEHEVISLGAGIRNAGIILRRDDLLRVVEIEPADFKDMKG